MVNDNNYWNSFYNLETGTSKPSNFAVFVKKIIKKNNIILEVATGNGRDAFYLRKFCKKIYAIDSSITAIQKNKKKSKDLKVKNLSFKNMTVNELSKFSNKHKINLIYARFFLHTINERKEDIFLKNFFRKFKPNTLLALEFRTTKDNLMRKGKKLSSNERYTDHYRRFIDVKKFEKKILDFDGTIIYKKSGLNFSKTKNENPYLCRIIIRSN